MKIFINTDGGARGNPGPAAIGIVFADEKESMIYSYKKCIGKATNNEAEYRAIITALEILLKSQWLEKFNHNDGEVICRLDSQLVVEQVNGNYKIKQDHIKKFIEELNELKKKFNLNLKFLYVPREKNKLADKLVNTALDEVEK